MFDLTLELVVVAAEEESQGAIVIVGVSGFLGEGWTGLVTAIGMCNDRDQVAGTSAICNDGVQGSSRSTLEFQFSLV